MRPADGFASSPIRADGEARRVWAVGRSLHGPTEAYWDDLEGGIGPASRPQLSYPQCLFSTSGGVIPSVTDSSVVMTMEGDVKALALLTAAALTLLSVAASAQTGPYYGKGKAPPPPAPVATKG
jgi:hypothetical protein